MKYRTFKRSARNWKEFGSARNITDRRGLTFEEAFMRCQEWNKNRTPAQTRAGTKMEFEKEET